MKRDSLAILFSTATTLTFGSMKIHMPFFTYQQTLRRSEGCIDRQKHFQQHISCCYFCSNKQCKIVVRRTKRPSESKVDHNEALSKICVSTLLRHVMLRLKLLHIFRNHPVKHYIVDCHQLLPIYTDLHKNTNTSNELSHFVHIIGSDMRTVMEEMIQISTKP